MPTATVEEVQARLPELLDQLGPGDELTIVANGNPVGRLLPAPPKGVPVLGRGRGKLVRYTEDDEHLKDFEDYMS
jgi:antitoxin (DNA-binding transcriptional repressor) of toxin-antitoxin stability system